MRLAAMGLALGLLAAGPAHAGFFDPPEPANPVEAAKLNPDMPADADPYYSTPKASDKDVDFRTTTRKTVADPTHEPPGTVTISTARRALYLSQPGGEAIMYRIAVGRQGFSWKGKAEIGRKAYWPGWTPPPEMLERQRDLPEHGTNEPRSIGKAVSSGCIRMLNADVIDLYKRVEKGTKVVVE